MKYDYPSDIQSAVFSAFSQCPEIISTTNGAIFDHVPTTQDLPDIYIRIGDEQIRNRSSKTNSMSESIFEVSIYSKVQGYIGAKILSSIAVETLTRDNLQFDQNKLIGIWFIKSQTYRLSKGNLRQIKLWFKAIIETPQTSEVAK